MSKGHKRLHSEMLTREKLLPSTNNSLVVFLSDKELQEKFKSIDFFSGKHISVPKK